MIFKEEEHPRDNDGKFTDKNGGEKSSAERLAEMKKAMGFREGVTSAPPVLEGTRRFNFAAVKPEMKDSEIYKQTKDFFESPEGLVEISIQEAIDRERYSVKSESGQKIARKTSVMSDAAAHAMYRSNLSIEPKITADITSICRANGGIMSGLEAKLKTEESLSGKIESDYNEKRLDNPGITYDAVTREIGDSIRYTSVVDSKKFARHVDSVLSQLEERGYKVFKFSNSFQADAQYKGLNCGLRTPNGVLMELQFHTPETIGIKEHFVQDGNRFRAANEHDKMRFPFPSHKYYEENRTHPDGVRRAYLINKMIKMWSTVTTPSDFDAISKKWTEKAASGKMKAEVR